MCDHASSAEASRDGLASPQRRAAAPKAVRNKKCFPIRNLYGSRRAISKNQNESPPPAPATATSTDAFLPVPVRHRHDGWTPERQRAFIEHLADTGSVSEAAALVGMTEQSAGRLRRRAGAQTFGAAWDAALRHGARRLLAGAFDRAINGTVLRRYYHGQLIGEERVYSERLMIYLLDKADRLLGHSPEADEALRDWDGWMERLERGEAHRSWKDRYGNWFTDAPPPEGFDGHEEGEPGQHDYCRTLTDAELDDVERGERQDQGAIVRHRSGTRNGGRTDRASRSKSRR